MSTKFKVRVSAMILCAAMFIASIVVFAGERWETVPLGGIGEGTIHAYIDVKGYYAGAESSGSSQYSDVVLTRIAVFTPNYYSEREGHRSVYMYTDKGDFIRADSTHKWEGSTHYLTVYP